MRERDLEIHVERIDLAAMPHGGERLLREALAREIVRLASPFAIEPAGHGEGAGRIGARIAGSIHEALPGGGRG